MRLFHEEYKVNYHLYQIKNNYTPNILLLIFMLYIISLYNDRSKIKPLTKMNKTLLFIITLLYF